MDAFARRGNSMWINGIDPELLNREDVETCTEFEFG